jgi:hypothetical protein
MAIIEVISKELNNTILENNISSRNPPYIIARSYGICKSRVACKCDFKEFLLSGKCAIRRNAVNANFKFYITKLYNFWKNLL